MNQCTIQINNLKLRINIGVEDEERNSKQDILLRLSITPLAPNTIFVGSISDNIDDTVDYHALCNFIKQLEGKSFNLIEKLAHDIFDLTTKFLEANCNLRGTFEIQVEICKHPEIDGLEGDVRFILKGDIQLDSVDPSISA